MKIKTFKAPDMRQAMRAIRDEFGADAVILATERAADGVLLTAAQDFDAAVVTSGSGVSAPPRPQRAGQDIGVGNDAALSDELRVLRRVLETQLSQLAWNDYSRREPMLAELQREFTAAGFDAGLMQTILADFPGQMTHAAARRLAMVRIADRLGTIGDRWLQFGGRLVLLGGTGVGKTSAVLRLAARWVQLHGARDIALVTADNHSLQAAERFAAQARLLGVPSYAIDTPMELPALLGTLQSRRLVIVDTAGLSPAAPAQAAAWGQLAAALPEVEFAHVAAASQCPAVVERLLAAPSGPRWQALLLTKLDETGRTGALLSLLARRQLPTSFVTRGRRWLQDFLPARASELVCAALDAEGGGSTANGQLARPEVA